MTPPRKNASSRLLALSAVAAATSVLVACGGGSSGSSNAPTPSAASMTMKGVVVATAYTPGSTTDPTFTTGYFQGATVCVDANNNGHCDSGEAQARTDARGAFSLTVADSKAAALIADIGTDATNTATGAKVATRTVLRVAQEQAAEQGGAVVISPLSSELVRQMEANGSTYASEKQGLADRLGTTGTQALADVNGLGAGALKSALMAESNTLADRFAYAITKLDRGDLYPDALANPGGDPTITGIAGVTAATATVADNRKPITFQQAEQAAFAVEGVPRYDHIFIVMLENKGTNKILNSPYAPKINAYMKAGNQFTSYYATGNPSEPNYTALGGGDDFGISDDSQWNCDATGANAPEDLPLPDNTQPGLASSPFKATCTQTAAVNHNIKNRPNLFNALAARGMTWRTYNESMNPGQDLRTDSVADAGVTANDNVYAPGTTGANATQVGNASLVFQMPAGLYKTKHHPGMAYQNVRSAPEFKWSNRTMGGGQWDANLKSSTAYAIPAGYDYDQFSTDLANGTVGSLNFVVPDQCDDMHGISYKATDGTSTPSDCGGTTIITRGDNYVDWVIRKIQSSPLWANRQKKVAIVVMFDEGSATSGFNGCCGWNPVKAASVTATNAANPLQQNADGSWSKDTSMNNYTNGNRGHGESVFFMLNNQPDAPKGLVDTDAYSHFSFVRTLQDMFGLADPKVDASYMNRTKYTERFIAQNILNLPEYAGSADTHFDAVRPMNHAFVIPATYTQKQTSDIDTTANPAQVGPDATQANLWSLKK